jgi:transposase-like protein
MEQKPRTLLDAIRAYGDADSALAETVDSRWPKGVICPHCDGDKSVFIKTRRIWMCSKCRKQFSIKAGTVFEDSPIGLDKWLPAVWMIAGDKNGISSWELHRALGVTQKTAWFMLHRIRLAMQSKAGGKLSGTVEVDETFIGAKARNMHKAERARKITGRGPEGKAIVAAVLERGGKVRAKVVETRRKPELQALVRENVEAGSNLYSDDLRSYDDLGTEFVRGVVNHAVEYVNGQIHTNGLENFWSLLKRSLKGTYVCVEPFHLFRYVDEQAFRYNNRNDMNDFDRFKLALSQIVGKRLKYDDLIAKEDKQSEVEPF